MKLDVAVQVAMDDVDGVEKPFDVRGDAGFLVQFTHRRVARLLARSRCGRRAGSTCQSRPSSPRLTSSTLPIRRATKAETPGRGFTMARVMRCSIPCGPCIVVRVMCGLYSFRKSPEEVKALFGYPEQPNFPPRDHVAPGQPIAIVRGEGEDRHFALVRWGFVPSWTKEIKPGKPLINARS